MYSLGADSRRFFLRLLESVRGESSDCLKREPGMGTKEGAYDMS